MNIYIEGPDATGKTTLAEWLSEAYDMSYEHLTGDCPNTFDYHLKLMDKQDAIYDRFCLGEVIYSKIYGREPKLTFDDCLKIMNRVVEQNDIFIILVTSDISILNKRLIERGELNYLDEIEEQNAEYIAMAYALRAYEYPGLIVWDIVDGNDVLKEYLSDYLEARYGI